MQTLERKTNSSKSSSPQGKRFLPALFLSRVFVAALSFFVLINLALASGCWNSTKHNLSEVLSQAQQEKLAGRTSRHSWAWWLTRLYLQEKQAPDVVVFGSSLLGSAHASIDAWCVRPRLAVDVLTQRRMLFLEDRLSKMLGHNVSIFSLGSPGAMISDFYVLSKALFVPGKKPALVIATIAPRDFIDSTLAYPAVTDHYKFFSNYVDLADTTSFAYPDFFARLGAEMERLPLKNLSKRALSRHAERSWTEWGQPEAACIEPGKSIVPAYLASKPVDNTKEYAERFKQPYSKNYYCQMKFFNRFLSDMKTQGIAVTIICMPTTESNRHLLPQSFWKRFRSEVSAACRANSADWLDLSDSGLFKQSDYLDTVHLNAQGAIKLFPLMAERVSTIPLRQSVFKVAP